MTGDLWTWGAGGHGRLGLGNTISWNSPQLVKEIQSVKQVSVSANHMLAIDGINNYFYFYKCFLFHRFFSFLSFYFSVSVSANQMLAIDGNHNNF